MATACKDKYTEKTKSFTVKEGNMEIEDKKEEENQKQKEIHQQPWQPSFFIRVDKEIHYYAGHEISIWQSLDSYGSTIWPAALALCQYLDTNRGTVNLLDKAVLEIGAGTGLVSIVASLLGAWVTAGDLPEVLGNLRSNLARNTRGRCRYTPQIAELTCGHKLKHAYPRSVYRYDYVLAADVIYQHDCLAELLVAMCHFCQPGTTLIWANKIRFKADLEFLENFKKAFNTTLLADKDDIKIYSATTKEAEEPRNLSVMLEQEDKAEEEEEEEEENIKEIEPSHVSNGKTLDQKPTETESKSSVYLEECNEKIQKDPKEDSYEEHEIDFEENSEENLSTGKNDQRQMERKNEESSIQSDIETKSADADKNAQLVYQRTWQPSMFYTPGKEIHYFLGHKISIEESLDSYGAVIWPAAVALCKFLDTAEGQQEINLLDKSVLEIGAGTGLLSIVATLLGAKLTATDLPEILSNLRYNLNRNTRQHRRHEPLVMALSWGHKLEETFPHSINHYDYVLAADVVYHHSFLAELLDTMHYFCQPGTTLIWANKIRYTSDWAFIEKFEKKFHATVIAQLDEVRIYKATYRAPDEEDDNLTESINEREQDKKHQDTNEECKNATITNENEEIKQYQEDKVDSESQEYKADEQNLAGHEAQSQKDFKISGIQGNISNIRNQSTEKEDDMVNEAQEEESKQEEELEEEDGKDSEGAEKEEESQCCGESTTTSNSSTDKGSGSMETGELSVYQRTWQPSMYYMPGKEIHCFLGHKISIEESLDSYGAVIWPAAVALCKFLDTPEGQQQINLLDKSVLEIGAGTGLLSIVTTLLGAKLTATDLPEILSNLRYNLNRNTRQRRRHEPLVMALSWGHKLEETFPHSINHYDYVLAADVVYHHSFLAELLDTMHYFCQPGTTLIWANKIRYTSDWAFIEKFEKKFHATVIAQLDEVRIYKATYKSAEDNL